MVPLQELHPAQKTTKKLSNQSLAVFAGYVDLSDDWACVRRMVAPKEPIFNHLEVCKCGIAWRAMKQTIQQPTQVTRIRQRLPVVMPVFSLSTSLNFGKRLARLTTYRNLYFAKRRDCRLHKANHIPPKYQAIHPHLRMKEFLKNLVDVTQLHHAQHTHQA